MLCKRRTQRQLVTDPSQLSASRAGRSRQCSAGETKPGARKDPEVSGVWEPGDVGTAPSPPRLQLLLEALWDAESVSKARQVWGREGTLIKS